MINRLMNSRIFVRISLLVFAMLGTGLSGRLNAQTPAEFRQRYGDPLDGVYKVREAITAKVTFDKNNQAVEIVVDPLEVNDARSAMSSAMAAEVLSEMMPVAQRGRLLKKGAFVASCISVQAEEYERVAIARTIRCDSQGGGMYRLNIRRK